MKRSVGKLTNEEIRYALPPVWRVFIAGAFLPDIIAFYESEEGQRNFQECKQEEEQLKKQSENE